MKKTIVTVVLVIAITMCSTLQSFAMVDTSNIDKEIDLWNQKSQNWKMKAKN